MYYLVGGPYTPIVFTAYLETLVGELSWGARYSVEVALVLITMGINAANINLVGNTVNTIM